MKNCILQVFLLIFVTINLLGCGDDKTTVQPTKDTVTTITVEPPILEISELNGTCEVESTCYSLQLNIPKEGVQKIDLGFSRIPEEFNLIVNNISYTLSEVGSIEIDLVQSDNVILEIRQDIVDDLEIWLNGFESNNIYYDSNDNIWKITFKYQKAELLFGIKPIATNVQQQVNSVTFNVFGENNLQNLYQADVYTLDGCLVGSGEMHKFGKGLVEVFFTNQCHDIFIFLLMVKNVII